jgi:hypothetical protein
MFAEDLTRSEAATWIATLKAEIELADSFLILDPSLLVQDGRYNGHAVITAYNGCVFRLFVTLWTGSSIVAHTDDVVMQQL